MSDGLTQAELEKLLMEFACEDIGELKERMKEYHQLCKMKAKLESDVKENQIFKTFDNADEAVKYLLSVINPTDSDNGEQK